MAVRYVSLGFFLLLVVAASAVSSMFGAGEWFYINAHRPAWTPPAWSFGPLWALIYLFMAIAAWNVWLTGQAARAGAVLWWGVLLALNIAWSAVMFGLQRPGWAWLLLCVTIVAALFCYRAFRLLDGQAARLLLPYLAWLLFSWVWALAFWSMNGGPLARFLS